MRNVRRCWQNCKKIEKLANLNFWLDNAIAFDMVVKCCHFMALYGTMPHLFVRMPERMTLNKVDQNILIWR